MGYATDIEWLYDHILWSPITLVPLTESAGGYDWVISCYLQRYIQTCLDETSHHIFQELLVNPISAGGGGGWNPPPPGFPLAIATKINRSTPNFLTFNFYYWDIIWAKIKLITCQGVTWSLFCRKHFVSPHIFHCIFAEFSCSTFSFSDIYIQCQLLSFGGKTYFWLSFYKSIEIQQKILMTLAFSKRSEFLMILVAFAAQNVIVSLEIWLFFN